MFFGVPPCKQQKSRPDAGHDCLIVFQIARRMSGFSTEQGFSTK
jgi:hypothetical protein